MNTSQSLASGDTPCWHVLSAAEVAQRLRVNPVCGLTLDEAERWAAMYGIYI